MSHKKNCILCGSDNTEPYLVADNCSFVRCRCGLMYMNPQPSKEKLAEYYNADYSPYIQKKTSLTPEEAWRATHSSLLIRMLRRIKRTLRPQAQSSSVHDTTRKTVLDFGCGNGRYLIRMQREHPLWELYGYDIDPRPVELAGVTTVNNLDSLDTKLDLINMSHVLEHLPDPKATLLQLKTLLKEGGEIIIEVPNIDCWKFRVFGRYFEGLCLPYHLFLFSPKTLNELATQCGLSIQSLEVFGSPKTTLHNIYNVLGVRRAVNPYFLMVTNFLITTFGLKKIDTEVLRARVRTARVQTL